MELVLGRGEARQDDKGESIDEDGGRAWTNPAKYAETRHTAEGSRSKSRIALTSVDKTEAMLGSYGPHAKAYEKIVRWRLPSTPKPLQHIYLSRSRLVDISMPLYDPSQCRTPPRKPFLPLVMNALTSPHLPFHPTPFRPVSKLTPVRLGRIPIRYARPFRKLCRPLPSGRRRRARLARLRVG